MNNKKFDRHSVRYNNRPLSRDPRDPNQDYDEDDDFYDDEDYCDYSRNDRKVLKFKERKAK